MIDFSKIKELFIPEGETDLIVCNQKIIWEKPKLPKGYKSLSYIETTGTQYIDTGFIPNQDSRIICEFMYTGGSGVYGARFTVAQRNFSMRVISGKWQIGYGDGVETGTIASDKNWHCADQNKNSLYIDGKLAATRDYVEFTAPHPIAIGAIKAGSVYYGEGRYRNFKIYDDDILAHDFLPCQNPDGDIGMYDIVNNVFLSNAGEGDFLHG